MSRSEDDARSDWPNAGYSRSWEPRSDSNSSSHWQNQSFPPNTYWHPPAIQDPTPWQGYRSFPEFQSHHPGFYPSHPDIQQPTYPPSAYETQQNYYQQTYYAQQQFPDDSGWNSKSWGAPESATDSREIQPLPLSKDERVPPDEEVELEQKSINETRTETKRESVNDLMTSGTPDLANDEMRECASYPSQRDEHSSLQERLGRLYESRFGRQLLDRITRLCSQELPQREERKADGELSGFAWMRPIEEYLGVPKRKGRHGDELDTHEHRRRAFETLRVNMLVRGVIWKREPAYVLVHVHGFSPPRVDPLMGDSNPPPSPASYSQLRSLGHLNITALCYISELGDLGGNSQRKSGAPFMAGDRIRAVVISVDPHSEKILISFNEARLAALAPNSKHRPQLGVLEGELGDSDSGSSTDASHATSHRRRESVKSELQGVEKYLDRLRADPAFVNPYALDSMMQHFNIQQHASLRLTHKYPEEDFQDKLRDKQNRLWAEESVRRGVAFAKEAKYPHAMKCYAHALDIDPECASAYVARGAAYANQSMLQSAIAQFDKALEICPTDANALKYLAITKKKLAEEKGAEEVRTPKAKDSSSEQKLHDDPRSEPTADKDKDAKASLVDIERIKAFLKAERKKSKKRESKKKRKRKKEKEKKKKEKEKGRDKGKRHSHKSKRKSRKRHSSSSSSSSSSSKTSVANSSSASSSSDSSSDSESLPDSTSRPAQ